MHTRLRLSCRELLIIVLVRHNLSWAPGLSSTSNLVNLEMHIIYIKCINYQYSGIFSFQKVSLDSQSLYSVGRLNRPRQCTGTVVTVYVCRVTPTDVPKSTNEDKNNGGSTLGQEAIMPPLNLSLVPKCDIKHWQTQIIGIVVQKGAFCDLQNTTECVSGRFSDPDLAGGAHDAPTDLLVGWGWDIHFHTPPHSRFSRLPRSPLCASICNVM